MPPRDQVDPVSVGVLIVVAIVSSLILFLPNLLAAAAGRDAWLVILAASPVVGLIFFALFRIFFFPGLTPIQRAGRWPVLRCAAALVLALDALYHAGLVLGENTHVLTTIYPETPSVVFHGTLMLAAWSLAAYGREVIARTALVFAPLVLAATVANVVLAVPGNADLGQLLPILEFGWRPILNSIPFVVATAAEALMLSVYADGIRDRQRLGRVLAISAAATMVLLAGATVTDLIVLGAAETARSVVPTLVVLRLVRLAPILARVETLIFTTWVLGTFIKLGVFVYVSALALRQGLGLRERWDAWLKGLVTVLTTVTASVLFPDTGRLQYHLQIVWPVVGITALLATLALGLVRPGEPGERR